MPNPETVESPLKKNRGGKRTEFQREEDKVFATKLHLKGYDVRSIAEEINKIRPYTISHTSVFKDLKQVEDDWHETQLNSMGRIKAHLGAKLNRVMVEAWEGWEKSKLQRVRELKELRVRKIDATFPNKPKKRAQPIPEKEEKATVMRENQSGDPRFLAIIRDVVKDLRDMYGVDAPKALEFDGRIDDAPADAAVPMAATSPLTEHEAKEALMRLARELDAQAKIIDTPMKDVTQPPVPATQPPAP